MKASKSASTPLVSLDHRSDSSGVHRHVGLLEIQDRDFSLTPIPLKTVRPFIFKEIVLADEEEEHNLKLDDKKKVTKFLKEEVRRIGYQTAIAA